MTTANVPAPNIARGPDASDPLLVSQRVPPHSIEAEVCTIGSMIIDRTAIDIVAQVCQAEYFFRPAHQTLYQTLIDMSTAGKPIELVTLREELSRLGLLEQIGGVDYLVAIVDGVPNAANAEYYAKIVRDKALLRDLIIAAGKITRDAHDSRDEAPDIIENAERLVFKIATAQIGDQAVTLGSLLQETFETLQESDGRLVTGTATGYPALDEMTSGFQNGEMIILAARPSMGKTSFLLNIAEHMAVTEKLPVVVFSMEMSKAQLAQRLLSSHARFNLRQMRRGMISAEDWTQLQMAAGDLEQAPLLIDDSPLLTALQLRSKARRLHASHGIKCVFIDYLQLMTYSGRADSRQEQITEMSRGIKALARELNIPVICAAQLNRGPADRPSHRPRMSDLRESGSIEQDADVVSLLHNEDYYHRGEPDYMPRNVTELIVAKQRNGPTGTVHLTFLPDCTRFESASPEVYDSGGTY
ncbi:MAG: replicative DNA helicase [Planctomycetaceae bacterium]|nr:replicative DNA helicase [Planctomycetaceae bacterium]